MTADNGNDMWSNAADLTCSTSISARVYTTQLEAKECIYILSIYRYAAVVALFSSSVATHHLDLHTACSLIVRISICLITLPRGPIPVVSFGRSCVQRNVASRRRMVRALFPLENLCGRLTMTASRVHDDVESKRPLNPAVRLCASSLAESSGSSSLGIAIQLHSIRKKRWSDNQVSAGVKERTRSTCERHLQIL